MQQLEQLYSMGAAAKVLGVSRATLYRLIARGRASRSQADGIFPIYRVGGQYRIPESALRRYLEAVKV